MTYHDDVLAIMRKDPAREYTAREIADAIFPPDGNKERKRTEASIIVRVLRAAERYGFVTGRTTGPRAYAWRLKE